MDILEFAMQMELDGKAFYEQQAAATANEGLRQISLSMAEEEERHYNYFKRLKENPDDINGVFTGPQTVKKIKNVFEQMADNPGGMQFGNDEISAWKEALKVEEKSKKFYEEQAEKEADPDRKRLFLKIAGEEQNHIYMIDGVLMYAKQPQTFADSAQFKNFRSLEGWGQD